MNAALRRTHRTVWLGLALVVPGGLGLALSHHVQRPVMVALPVALTGDRVPDSAPLLVQDDLWQGARIRTRLWSSPPVVELDLLDPLRQPDPLVYWTATEDGGMLPPDAVLLGALPGSGAATFPLPRPGGRLLVFSLAHGKVLAWAALPGAP